MADTKISGLPEEITLNGTEEFPLVQASTKRCGIDTLFSSANAVWQGWTMLTAPLTSTSWDGDAYSTTAKTLIDLSAVFSVPAGAKAISVRISCRDSGSAATSSVYFGLSPNNTADSFAVDISPRGITNDYYVNGHGIVPCDASGDVYYQILATGASTMDCYIQIWGYLM